MLIDSIIKRVVVWVEDNFLVGNLSVSVYVNDKKIAKRLKNYAKRVQAACNLKILALGIWEAQCWTRGTGRTRLWMRAQPTQGCWQEAAQCWAQVASQCTDNMQNLHLIFLNWCSAWKKNANIAGLPSYRIKAALEQGWILSTGHQVTFRTLLLNQWLMGHSWGWGDMRKSHNDCLQCIFESHTCTHTPSWGHAPSRHTEP